MAPLTKLRVALEDSPSGLEVATAKVHLATGLGVRADFQEIDRNDLIVELSISEAQECPPGQLGRLVQRSSTNLEVLSSWSETAPAIAPGRNERPTILRYDELAVPSAARRAFDDRLPTARWQASTDGDVPHWLLAVPAASSGDRLVAGVLRRNGYSYRFSALEATALRAILTASTAA